MPNRQTPLPPVFPRPSGPERRTGHRYSCQWDAPFRVGDHFGTATVRDLSQSGICLVLGQRVAPGKLFTVELLDRAQNSWHLKLLRAVHSTPHGHDRWLVGSAFTRELSADELEAVLN